MIGTIQERNRKLYVVVQNGGQFEYYPTIFQADAFRAAYGSHDGEQVESGNVAGTWHSLDGQRKYVLSDLKPEWVEGVKLEFAETPKPQIAEAVAVASEGDTVIVPKGTYPEIPNKEVAAVEMKKEAAPKKPRPKRKR
jgi:hypothetical protein